jgi:hypothetical protein
VPLCPQIPYGLTWAWTRASAVRRQRLTAWTIWHGLRKLYTSLLKIAEFSFVEGTVTIFSLLQHDTSNLHVLRYFFLFFPYVGRQACTPRSFRGRSVCFLATSCSEQGIWVGWGILEAGNPRNETQKEVECLCSSFVESAVVSVYTYVCEEEEQRLRSTVHNRKPPQWIPKLFHVTTSETPTTRYQI